MPFRGGGMGGMGGMEDLLFQMFAGGVSARLCLLSMPAAC